MKRLISWWRRRWPPPSSYVISVDSKVTATLSRDEYLQIKRDVEKGGFIWVLLVGYHVGIFVRLVGKFLLYTLATTIAIPVVYIIWVSFIYPDALASLFTPPLAAHDVATAIKQLTVSTATFVGMALVFVSANGPERQSPYDAAIQQRIRWRVDAEPYQRLKIMPRWHPTTADAQ